jgi:hypothetical protein
VRYTEDGFRIYTMEELGIGKGKVNKFGVIFRWRNKRLPV